MATEQYDTPSGNPSASPAEFAFAFVARRLRELSDGYFARLETYRGLSQSDRESMFAREAEHARDLKHLAGELEQLWQSLVGYRSDREIRRVPARSNSAKRAAILMGALAAVITALAAAWTAIAGKGKP